MTKPATDPSSERVRLQRGAQRGAYDPKVICDILDAGTIAHVAVTTPEGPLALPMAYAHDRTDLFLHGANANAVLNAAIGHDINVTVTVLDGLIIGRSPLHNSATYRSVVVRGTARQITDIAHKQRALQRISDHVIATWDRGRLPTPSELRRTLVIAIPLAEASAKIRTGGPIDEPHDLNRPHWAGTIPIVTRFTTAQPSPDLAEAITTPSEYLDLDGRELNSNKQ